MDAFESYAQSLVSPLDLPDRLKSRIQDEIIAHLEEERERCVRQAIDPERAEREALERFGQCEAIRGLMDTALARSRRRFRLFCSLGTAMGVHLALALGAWLNALDDVVASGPVSSLKLLVYVCGLVLALGCLTALAARIFRCRAWQVALAAVGVILAHIASMVLLGVIPLLRAIEVVGSVEYANVLTAFCMRLYLCWAPTSLVFVVVLLRQPTRRNAIALAEVLAVLR